MRTQIASLAGWLLVLFTSLIYLYGVGFAIFNPLDKDGSAYIPEPLDNIVSTIGAILLTNLGAVLGISVAKPNSAFARFPLLVGQKGIAPDPVSQRETIQYIAVIVYMVVLVACFFKWASVAFVKDGDPKKVVPIVIQNGKNLIGVIAAYAAYILSNKS